MSISRFRFSYDAMGRMIEQNPSSGNYYQIVYSPMGSKLAVMKGQTIQQAFVPLPGGTTAEYLSWGLSNYRHPDWLGSERLESSTTHAILQDTAYAPFGEPYAELSGGNGEISFTGQNKDTDWLDYDSMYREYDPRQSRWISPDPDASDAVDPSDPRSWNRYAYVENNPLSLVDPLGFFQAIYPTPDDPPPDLGTGFEFLFGDNTPDLFWLKPTKKKDCMAGPLNLHRTNLVAKILSAKFWLGLASGDVVETGTAAASYYSLIKTGGAWDPKDWNPPATMTPANIEAGNVNFGSTCAQFGLHTKIGGEICQYGAGINAHWRGAAGTTPYSSPSHGDQPPDN